MKSITRSKPLEEIQALLAEVGRVFVVGCGTCTTLCRTGGVPEVEQMAAHLREAGKLVTGSFVPATACDDLTPQLLEAHRQPLADAQVVLAMSCAFGVQNLAATVGKRVVPALDTLFFGLETSPGCYQEVCRQCGQCILGETAGICPVTACHKGLVNGPCGGTNRGKCEIDKEKDCAWTSIYLRLKELGQLELMRKYHQPRNHQVFPKPGKMTMQDGRSDRP